MLLSHPELTEKPAPTQSSSVYELQGQKPSVFLRSSPLECKSGGREGPHSAQWGRTACLAKTTASSTPHPLKASAPPNYREEMPNTAKAFQLLLQSQTLLCFYHPLFSPPSFV